ncbi:ABC transporter ATP-binding protein [Halomicrobium sp. HM KBTZ05]|uniref:ABC transporter ATP-binding protein n=1 Tax=Halomicrobium sp. HM KBTZ05 TaxID=3242663 RepID=UPI00355708C3
MTLEVSGLTHRYGSKTAVEDVSFSLADGEIVGLLGPSGCGKTTIVQAIAGHLSPTAGRIWLRGEDVTRQPPERRRVSVVFQESTLYPHMTVGENVAYGLEAREVDRSRIDALVETHLELVSLASRRDASPAELSGGQKRRVELARALAPEPDVLLLDEPLSALDRSLREELRRAIGRIQRETGVTTLFVTHDQADAMALADRLVVMNEGAIAGVDTPRALYESPPTPFVASFLGRSNTVGATVVEPEPLVLAVGEQTLTLPEARSDRPAGASVSCHVRPADLALAGSDSAETVPTLSGAVSHVTDRGSRYDVSVTLPTDETVVVERQSEPPAVGATVTVRVPAAKLTRFGADTAGE